MFSAVPVAPGDAKEAVWEAVWETPRMSEEGFWSGEKKKAKTPHTQTNRSGVISNWLGIPMPPLLQR